MRRRHDRSSAEFRVCARRQLVTQCQRPQGLRGADVGDVIVVAAVQRVHPPAAGLPLVLLQPGDAALDARVARRARRSRAAARWQRRSCRDRSPGWRRRASSGSARRRSGPWPPSTVASRSPDALRAATSAGRTCAAWTSRRPAAASARASRSRLHAPPSTPARA